MRYIQEDGMVKDTISGFKMDIYYVVDLLNMKEDKIKELEDALQELGDSE